MRSLKLIALIIPCFLAIVPMYAQNKIQVFEAIHLPRKAEYSLIQLNKDLVKAKNLKQAENIILNNKSIKPCRIVLATVNKDGEKVWHIVNSEEKKKESGSWVILRSKDVFQDKFKDLNDLRNALADTVLVLDTLKLSFYMSGQRYDNKGFFLSYRCPSDQMTKKLLLSSPTKDEFLLTKESLGCSEDFLNAKVLNQNDPERELAKVTFYFADQEFKDELKSVIAYLATAGDYSNPKELALTLQAYVRQGYGKIQTGALIDWLKKQ